MATMAGLWPELIMTGTDIRIGTRTTGHTPGHRDRQGENIMPPLQAMLYICGDAVEIHPYIHL